MENPITESLQEAEFTELKDYPVSWVERVLSAACLEAGLPLTAENKLKFASNLESDLECEFHGGDA